MFRIAEKSREVSRDASEELSPKFTQYNLSKMGLARLAEAVRWIYYSLWCKEIAIVQTGFCIKSIRLFFSPQDTLQLLSKSALRISLKIFCPGPSFAGSSSSVVMELLRYFWICLLWCCGTRVCQCNICTRSSCLLWQRRLSVILTVPQQCLWKLGTTFHAFLISSLSAISLCCSRFLSVRLINLATLFCFLQTAGINLLDCFRGDFLTHHAFNHILLTSEFVTSRD